MTNTIAAVLTVCAALSIGAGGAAIGKIDAAFDMIDRANDVSAQAIATAKACRDKMHSKDGD